MKIYQVDAFTRVPFLGNPAGVCLMDKTMPDQERWMQTIAAEMNLSETAFIQLNQDPLGLRWFTPTVEVALCGHATLAAAHILWQHGVVPANSEIRFMTKSGLLSGRKSGHQIELDFPAKPAEQTSPPDGLEKALGVTAKYVGKSSFDYLVHIESDRDLRLLKPNFDQLKKLPVRGIIVTAASDEPGFDFISRFFAPAAGVNEDPVTGSAHCTLACYWNRLLGKTEMVGYQASTRTGIVKVRFEGDRVALIGEAVTVMECDLLV